MDKNELRKQIEAIHVVHGTSATAVERILRLFSVVGRSEQLAVSHTFEANDNFSGLCKHCKKGKLFHG